MDKLSIFEHKFEEEAQLSVFDEYVQIGDIKIGYYHSQDCCEHVYADFSSLDYHKEELNKKGIKSLEIYSVEDMGIIFFFYGKFYPDRLGVLVNCYNSQNGYYSDDLELVITSDRLPGAETRINISDVTYDDID